MGRYHAKRKTKSKNSFIIPKASIETLVDAAKGAGIDVPDNLKKYNKEDYMHFWILSNIQLGLLVPIDNIHLKNAKIIASFTKEQLLDKKTTLLDLVNRGYIPT